MIAKRKKDGVIFSVEKFKNLNKVFYFVGRIDTYKANEFHKIFQIIN